MTEEMSVELLQRRLERERRARQDAERLLDLKAAELHDSNRELHEASERLFASSVELQAIIDAINLSIITIDDDGLIQSHNDFAERMFGYAGEDMVGRYIGELLPKIFGGDPGQDSAALLSSDQLAALDGIPAEIAIRWDGSTFPADFSISDTVVEERRIIIVVVRDISKRVEREQERRQLETRLVQAQKLESLGTLAAGIAHEINTPTQYIGDNLRFLIESFEDLETVLDRYGQLRDGAQGDERLCEVLGAVETAIESADLDYLLDELPKAMAQSLEGVQQVASIVQAMKEFSHPGSKSREAIDFNRAVENALAVSRNSWKHVAELETAFDDDLGSVSCVAAEINQVLLNLIVNAAHAMEGGETLGRLTVSTQQLDGVAELRVADSGCGIPEEICERIFDPFFTTKDVGKGTGQGLAIVQDIVVNKHGGEISVESTPGEGSCFVVRLPLEADDSELEAVA